MPENDGIDQRSYQEFLIGTKAVVKKDGRVLLFRSHTLSDGVSYWDLPGGRVDGDEGSLENALQREISEELPQAENVDVVGLVHASWEHHISSNKPITLLIYEITADLPEKIDLSDEHTDYAWVNEDEFLELTKNSDSPMFSGMEPAVLKVLAK